jgi:hypothetical protein
LGVGYADAAPRTDREQGAACLGDSRALRSGRPAAAPIAAARRRRRPTRAFALMTMADPVGVQLADDQLRRCSVRQASLAARLRPHSRDVPGHQQVNEPPPI